MKPWDPRKADVAALLKRKGKSDMIPGAPRRKNGHPEEDLQAAVAAALSVALRPDVQWTASAAGVRVAKVMAFKMKRAGVRRGWPDLQFLLPDGRFGGIELKAAGGLRPEQRAFRDSCSAAGAEWALCRTVEQVLERVTAWGLTR